MALVADAIQDCSQRDGRVLDCFAGSGTTLVAAERTGRQGYAMEYDPAYCDVIIQRLAQLEGLTATHLATGLEFEALREERTQQTDNDTCEAHDDE